MELNVAEGRSTRAGMSRMRPWEGAAGTEALKGPLARRPKILAKRGESG